MGIKPRPEDLKLSDLMRAYWISFAKTGDPNGPGLPEWPAFSEKLQVAMIFNGVSEAKPLPNLDKLKAFDGYYAWRREEVRKKAGASE